MNPYIFQTPFRPYEVCGRVIQVKREDMCVGGPRFSKMRGVAEHIIRRPEDRFGVLDTFHSKAGWGTAFLCSHLGRKAVVFYPIYKDDCGLRIQQREARKCGAELVGLTAGRSAVLYHSAKKILAEKYPGAYMLPNALKLQESVDETANELCLTTPQEFLHGANWIVSISSGTIAAGVIKGLELLGAKVTVWLHMGYSRPAGSVRKYIYEKAGPNGIPIRIVDEHYEYKDRAKCDVPFPCNPYYDLKAWRWLRHQIETGRRDFEQAQIIFWNIGA
jgi:hypothetical protein